MKKVGIVTRTNDRVVLLERALKSIKEQTYPFWELVIVNDGSNEHEILNLIDKIMLLNKTHIKIISLNEKSTFGFKINVGINSLKTDYIVIHDDDDSWDENFLLKSVEYLEKDEHRDYGGVICHTDMIYESVEGNLVKKEQQKRLNRILESEINLWNTLNRTQFLPISFLFRKQALVEVGSFSDKVNYSEDWEFYVRFLEKYKIGVIPEVLAYYHIRKKILVGTLTNTVVVGENLHDLSKNTLREQWLREDFENLRVSKGLMAYLSNKLGEQEIENRKIYRKLKEVQKINILLLVCLGIIFIVQLVLIIMVYYR